MPENVPVQREWRFDLVGWRDRRGRFLAVSESARAATRDAARAAGKDLREALRRESPRGKSPRPEGERFANQWQSRYRETENGAEQSFENKAPHAPFVLFPTKPHAIVAKRAKVLRFEVNGSLIFRRRVAHPGTKGNDVIGRTLSREHDALQRRLQTVTKMVQQRVIDTWGVR